MPPLTSSTTLLHPLGYVPREGDGTGRTARSLSTLVNLALPVPPGFVVTADAAAANFDVVATGVREFVAGLHENGAPAALAVRSDPLGDEQPVPPALGIPTADALLEDLRARWDAAPGPAAVVVQRLVRADADARSGSGIVFTRDPVTGSPGGYGRFAAGAAGDLWHSDIPGEPLYSLRHASPDAWDALETALPVIETAVSDMCEVRFTVEAGRLWLLQARPGPRHPVAEVRIAVDMVDEGLITVPQAFERVRVPALRRLQAPVLSRDQPLDVVARGRGAAPGVASGPVVFGAVPGVLVTDGPMPAGLQAHGILTSAVDGMRRLAAGPPAVSVTGLRVDRATARAHVAEGQVLAEGEHVTVDGGTGIVVRGVPRLVAAPLDHTLARFLDWCDARAEGRVTVVPAPLDDEVLIELSPDATEAAVTAAVQGAVASGARQLGLCLPRHPFTVDPHPPLAPWKSVVAGPQATWAARLVAARLAARLDYDPA